VKAPGREKIIIFLFENSSIVDFSMNFPPIGHVPLSGLESPSRKQNLISGTESPAFILNSCRFFYPCLAIIIQRNIYSI
jgi:hypothetical protein